MAYFVYILYSKQADKFYIGQTENLNLRLSWHRQKLFNQSFTKIANDWEIIFRLKAKSREQALAIEKFVKNQKSKIFIKTLIDDPSKGDWLIDRFKES